MESKSRRLVYVYCVVERCEVAPNFPTRNVGFGKPRKIPYRNIEAVVSDVPSSRFNQARLDSSSKDLVWLADAATRHELAIERVMDSLGVTPVPMKLCTLFRSDERVRCMVRDNYADLTRSLRGVAGRVEFGVTGFAGEGLELLAPNTPKLERLMSKLQKSSPGAGYFLKQDLKDARRAEYEKRLSRATKQAYELLRKEASGAVLSGAPPAASLLAAASQSAAVADRGREGGGSSVLLSRHIGDREEPMVVVLNSAFLVDRAKVDSFTAKFEGLRRKFAGEGLLLRLTGPWPPYNFS